MLRKFSLLWIFFYCYAANAFPALSPYVGVDGTFRHMGFQPTFGKDLFKKTVPQGSGYVGIQLMDCLALEGGYEAIRTKSKNVTLNPGDWGLGVQVPPGDPAEVHVYKQKLTGWYVRVLGILPCFSPEPSLRPFVGVGVSRKKVRLVDTLLGDATGALAPIVDTFVKRKTFLHLSIGMQKLVSEGIGVRLILNWEQTNKFGNLKTPNAPNPTAKLKNSLSGGMGIFFMF